MSALAVVRGQERENTTRMLAGGLAILLLVGGCMRTGSDAPPCQQCACDHGTGPDLVPSDAVPVDLRRDTHAADTHAADMPPLDLSKPDQLTQDHYLRFDTDSDSVRLDQVMSWAADFTVSVKIRLLAPPADYRDFLIGFGYDPVAEDLSGWEIGFKSSKLRWFVVNHDKDPFPNRCEKNSNQTMTPGTWYLVTFVFDYTSTTTAALKMYVDGQLWIDMSSPGSTVTQCQATMAPGPLEPATFRLGGMDQVELDADDLRVFDRVLTQSEAASLGGPVIPAGQILHWNMNEGTGTKVNDATGNGLTGTVKNPDWRTY